VVSSELDIDILSHNIFACKSPGWWDGPQRRVRILADSTPAHIPAHPTQQRRHFALRPLPNTSHSLHSPVLSIPQYTTTPWSEDYPHTKFISIDVRDGDTITSLQWPGMSV